jgi:hypothetical protein
MDPHYRYNFYTDTGGIDLAATKSGKSLLVEAKGKSTPARLGIEQLVGRTVLSMEPDRSDRSYAILIPDLPQWNGRLRRPATRCCPRYWSTQSAPRVRSVAAYGERPRPSPGWFRERSA